MEKTPPRTESKLSFQPLTSGLGFHPFSDGMPYAPVTKAAPVKPREPQAVFQPPMPTTYTPRPAFAPQSAFAHQPARAPGPPARPAFTPPSRPLSGPAAPSGAHSAGAPRYAPRVSVPVAGSRPAASLGAAMTAPLILKEAIEPRDLLGVGESYGVGYLIKRVLAYGLDTFINLGLCAGAMMASLWNQGINAEVFWTPGVILMVGLFLTAFNWAVITAQEVAFGTSLGKKAFGLAIEGPVSLIFMRSLFFLISAGFCGVGLFWAVATPRKRCWHDLVVNIQPIEIASL